MNITKTRQATKKTKAIKNSVLTKSLRCGIVGITDGKCQMPDGGWNRLALSGLNPFHSSSLPANKMIKTIEQNRRKQTIKCKMVDGIDWSSLA